MRIAIVDRARGPAAAPTDGRAFAVWAGAKAVLEGLGVWQAIAGEAEAMTSIEISDSALQDGMRPTRLTYDARTPDGRPAAYMVPAATLSAALYQSIANEPSVTWIAPAEADGLAADRAVGGGSASRSANDQRGAVHRGGRQEFETAGSGRHQNRRLGLRPNRYRRDGPIQQAARRRRDPAFSSRRAFCNPAAQEQPRLHYVERRGARSGACHGSRQSRLSCRTRSAHRRTVRVDRARWQRRSRGRSTSSCRAS